MAVNDIVLLIIVLASTLIGLAIGFVKSASKIFCFAGSGVISFYLGGLINRLLIDNSQAIRDFANQNGFTQFIVLAATYIAVFLVFFIITKIIFHLLNNLLNTTEAGKVINRILGVVVGIAIGLCICDIYVWATYGLSYLFSGLGSWIINDTQMNIEGHFKTMYEVILELNLGAIGQTVSNFPGLV